MSSPIRPSRGIRPAHERRARGYRSNRNFIAMIYLIVGKLNAGPAIA